VVLETVTVVLSVMPPLVALTVALPGAFPVTTPDAEMVATEALLDDQEIGAVERTLPVPSFTTAAIWVDWPTDNAGRFWGSEMAATTLPEGLVEPPFGATIASKGVSQAIAHARSTTLNIL
jgi:hypothetical protein